MWSSRTFSTPIRLLIYKHGRYEQPKEALMRLTRRKAGVVGVVFALAAAGAAAALAERTPSSSGNTPPVTDTIAGLDAVASTTAADAPDAVSAEAEQESADDPSDDREAPNDTGAKPVNNPATVQPPAVEEEDEQGEQEDEQVGEQGEQEDEQAEEQGERQDEQAAEQAEQEDDQAGGESEQQDEDEGDQGSDD